MALTDTNALTTLATVKAELRIATADDDEILERQILSASAAIERFCSREFRREQVSERLRGTDRQTLLVRRRPLTAIASIVEDGTALDPSRYRIDDARAGIIWSEDVFAARNAVIPFSVGQDGVPGTGEARFVVTYTGGYVLPNDATGTRNLPHDVEEACILTVVSMYRGRGRDRSIASQQVGDASVSYDGGNTAIGRGEGGVIPDAAAALLRRHRLTVFA